MNIQSLRRFDLKDADPSAVTSLAADHAAIRERRTVYPTTVIDAKDAPRLLVSGHNNRKIGKEVQKGEWAGMPIYTLTLEERATCPPECHMYRSCYGNAMHMARRLRHGEEFESHLAGEIVDLADEHPDGFVVRLHVLGDFYSRGYVYIWGSLLERYPQLRVFGYTARSVGTGDPDSKQIARAIHDLNTKYPERCFIRFSSAKPQMFGATVLNYVPDRTSLPEGIVCPAETSDTECCATCGLCWSQAMRYKTIFFIKHGRGSSEVKAEVALQPKSDSTGVRRILGLTNAPKVIEPIKGEIIDIRKVAPTDLYVDEAYQRNLSAKGVKMIRKMVQSFDWRRMRPPVVTEDSEGRLHVIDGQHTAIAAATHPKITTIPVIVVDAETLAERAATFVGINRDRIAVTPAQVFYAEIASGNAEAAAVKKLCDDCDVIVLRQAPPTKDGWGPGETLAISTLRRIYRTDGPEILRRALTVCRSAEVKPISEYHLRGVAWMMTNDTLFDPPMPDEEIAERMKGFGEKLLAKAYALAADGNLSVAAAISEVLYDRKEIAA